tara:strand:- start:1903 stop:2151 length:249 start_codon:yes stop_codon:yes gene_type:complete
MKKVVIIIGTLILLSSCGDNILDKKYSKKSCREDMSQIVKEIPNEDYVKICFSLFSKELIKDTSVVTYRELLNKNKNKQLNK